MTTPLTPTTPPRTSRLPIRLVVLFAALATTLMVWLFRDAFQGWVIARGTLANDAPSSLLIEDYFRKAPEPDLAILAAWKTGKIVHRQFAIRQLATGTASVQKWTPALEGILLSGALDPDLNVRESALAGLRSWRHPALTAMAAAQLHDPDPQVRLLGLDHLKLAVAQSGVPLVAPLMDDPDLRVAGRAIKLLERWSDEDFGVKLADTVEVDNPQTGLKEFRPEGIAQTRAAAERARAWWSRRESDFPPVQLDIPRSALAGLSPIAAGDFSLPTLERRKVRLSDFRGKTVIVNFWTTWCTACLGEIPALVELQKRHGERLAILGVSLDYVPDSHGHIGGHGSTLSDRAEDDHEEHAGHDHEDHAVASLKEIRAKVARMVKKLGINYTVVLDERNLVGGRFNGGELPTTVIIDPQGNIRRRFVGARALPVFEAMLAEVLEPEQSSAAVLIR